MSENEKHYFFSRVLQREKFELRVDRLNSLQIDIDYVKLSRCWYDDPTYIDAEISIAAKITVSICYSCSDHRQQYAEAMADQLSIMGIPIEEQPIVLEKLFQVLRVARPLRRITVVIADITAHLLGGFRDDDTIHRLITECPGVELELEYQRESCVEMFELRDVDYHPNTSDRITWGSFDTDRLRFFPATRSSIDSLQKVRLDSLGEAIIKQNPTCSICKDEFAEEGRGDQLIIPLPCAHYYHVHCIVQWLDVNHVGPLCRYALPTVEEGGAIEFLRLRLGKEFQEGI